VQDDVTNGLLKLAIDTGFEKWHYDDVDDRKLSDLCYEEAKAKLPDYVRALEGGRSPWEGGYNQILTLWMSIERLTAGTKVNRLELGETFRQLRDIYSDRNLGGNRRTSGHGTFEKECLDRGYKPRTVRDLIADYEAFLSGESSAAEKRKERQQSGLKADLAKNPTVDPIPEAPALPEAARVHEEAQKIYGSSGIGPTRQNRHLAQKMLRAARSMAGHSGKLADGGLNKDKVEAWAQGCRDRKELKGMVDDLQRVKRAVDSALPILETMLSDPGCSELGDTMDAQEEKQLARDARTVCAVLGLKDGGFELVDLDAPALSFDAAMALARQGAHTLGLLALVSGEVKVSLDEPATAAALTIMANAAISFAQRVAGKGDGVDWLERLGRLPDTRG
jgi:hypothetical protein